MRVKIEALGIYTYPDLSVVCGSPRVEERREDTLLNPLLLIEVLSPSTERYDRGMKFRRYQLIPSFAEYLLIAQDRPRIEHYLRQDDGGWVQTISEDLTATAHPADDQPHPCRWRWSARMSPGTRRVDGGQ